MTSIRIRRLVTGFVALVLLPQVTSAQSPDSLLQMLDAPDWRTRSQAVSRLNQIPVSELPAGAADRLIDLLIQDELDPPPESERKGEGFGEYQLALHRAVLRLRDPRSARALALNGVQMSGKAQEFVASLGGRAVPHLEEAWERDPLGRYGVVQTWSQMLAKYSGRLTEREKLKVREGIFRALSDVGLTGEGIDAARAASLIGVIPLLKEIEDTTSFRFDREAANEALNELAPMRRSMSDAELAADLATWLDALCLEPEAGPKRGACRSLENRLSNARRHLEGGRNRPARNVLQSFIRKVKQAHRQGAFTDHERTLLVGNAEGLLERL